MGLRRIADVLEELLHDSVQSARSDVVRVRVDLVGDFGQSPEALVSEVERDAVCGHEGRILLRQGVLGLRQDAVEVLCAQGAELDADREAALMFFFFFGYYSIIKGPLDRVRPKPLQFVIKTLIFNAAVIAAYWIVINLFGIKGIGPAGTVNMRTGEQTADGTSYSINAGFRVYNTYTECIEDRADLLKRVYSDLTEGVEDANTFAMRIGGRWATDVDYGLTLISVMERYDLYRLDEMTVGEFSDMLGTFVNPCPGARLTSDFGYRKAPTKGASTYHKGIDLGTGEHNIPTYAAAEGTVTFAGEAGSAGMLIVIDHGDGLVTKYMHHDKIYVEEGDEVEKGQQIGLSGTTGVSTGNHLHFQVEEDGTAVDPMEYLINIEDNQ